MNKHILIGFFLTASLVSSAHAQFQDGPLIPPRPPGQTNVPPPDYRRNPPPTFSAALAAKLAAAGDQDTFRITITIKSPDVVVPPGADPAERDRLETAATLKRMEPLLNMLAKYGAAGAPVKDLKSYPANQVLFLTTSKRVVLEAAIQECVMMISQPATVVPCELKPVHP